MSVEVFLMIANFGAMMSAIISGVIVGATYGYMLSHEAPPRYPTTLWLVGLFFIFGQVVVGWLVGEPVFAESLGAARAVLWTAFCGTIPLGRWGRYRLDLAWLRAKHRKISED